VSVVLCGCRCSAISTVDTMGAIDGHVGEGPMESEVWLVPVWLEPQQKKLGHHGRVGFWLYA
jgi:hypothetical protein